MIFRQPVLQRWREQQGLIRGVRAIARCHRGILPDVVSTAQAPSLTSLRYSSHSAYLSYGFSIGVGVRRIFIPIIAAVTSIWKSLDHRHWSDIAVIDINP